MKYWIGLVVICALIGCAHRPSPTKLKRECVKVLTEYKFTVYICYDYLPPLERYHERKD